MNNKRHNITTNTNTRNKANSTRTIGLVLAGVVVIGLVAWLAFGFFGVQTLFTTNEVSESGPVFDASPATTLGSAGESASGESAAGESAAVEPGGDETMAPRDEDAASANTTDTSAATAPEIVIERVGVFASDGGHTTTGDAVVLGNGTAQRFLRFENFETDNGPDLFVYLRNSATGDTSDFVDLGQLKGNVGEQNYEIPADVNLDTYDSVVIWCKRFSTPFGLADLATP